jgi:hypothetical protein
MMLFLPYVAVAVVVIDPILVDVTQLNRMMQLLLFALVPLPLYLTPCYSLLRAYVVRQKRTNVWGVLGLHIGFMLGIYWFAIGASLSLRLIIKSL